MSMLDTPTEFVELANHVRRVRTPEGAKFYGLPIGSPITADVIQAKQLEHAANGIHPPKGGLTSATKSTGGSKPSVESVGPINVKNPSAPNTPSAASPLPKHTRVPEPGKPAKAPPKMKLKLKKSTIKGNQHFSIGKSSYNAPQGSKLIKPKENPGLAYVVTPDGDIHAFNEAGEIEIPKAVKPAFQSKLTSDLTNDPKYAEVDFDATSSAYGLDQLKTGAVLTDDRDQPQFTKQADGTWKHNDFGVSLDEKDIQPLFDSGELKPQATPEDQAAQDAFGDVEATNFADMSKDEFTAALDKFPEGQKISYGDNGQTATKDADGKWDVDVEDTGMKFDSADFYSLKSQIKLGAAEDKPDATDKQSGDKIETPEGAPATPPAEKPAKPFSDLKEGDQVHPDHIDQMQSGDAIVSKHGTIHTKGDDGGFLHSTTSEPGTKMKASSKVEDLKDSAKNGSQFVHKHGTPVETPKPETKEEPPAPSQPARPKSEDKALDTEGMKNMSVGEKVSTAAGAVYEKTGNDEWTNASSGNSYNTDSVGALAETIPGSLKKYEGPKGAPKKEPAPRPEKPKAEAPKLQEPPAPLPENFPSDEPKTPALGDDDDIVKQFLTKSPTGSIVEAKGDKFIKAGPDAWWKNGDINSEFSDKHLATLDPKNLDKTLALEPEEQTALDEHLAKPEVSAEDPVAGKSATAEDVLHAEAGDQMVYQAGPAKDILTFNGSSWDSKYGEEGETYGIDEVQSYANAGGVFLPKGKDTVGPKLSPGNKITSTDDMDELPEGAALTYLKKDGSTSEYAKLKNGLWLTPGGGQMASSQLKYAAKSEKFTIKSVPETDAPQTESPKIEGTVYGENDLVKKYGHLREMPTGSVIASKVDSAYTGALLEKQEDGSWIQTNGAGVGAVWEPGDLASDVTQDLIYYQHGPAGVPAAGDDAQLWDGGPVVSNAQMTEAVNALESHTGFQIKYGMKSLPEDHPLASLEAQDELKKAALAEYPDLKPKPAVVAYLKDKAGIAQDAKKTVVSDPTAPKITIGSSTPEKGVQGFDGGEFTAAEVQDAINILENYPGKLFKNELNKKGNPLGALNPNDIIGFDKDKLASKQKFIDTLKLKVAGLQEKVDHPTVKTLDELKSYPTGTKVTFQGSYEGALEHPYTKVGPETWVDDNSPTMVLNDALFGSAIAQGEVHVDYIPDDIPSYASTPLAVQDKHANVDSDYSLDPAYVSGMPFGTVLVNDSEDIFYTKVGDGDWSGMKNGKNISAATDHAIEKKVAAGDVTLPHIEGPEFNKSGALPGKYQAPGGTAYMIIKADGTGIYVNGKGTPSDLTVEKVKANLSSGILNYVGIPDYIPTPPAPQKQKATPKPKPKTVSDIPDGTYFAGAPNDPKSLVYEVNGDTAKVFKPKSSTADTGVKIGNKTNATWMHLASDGAVIKGNGYYYEGSSYVKKDGKWVSTETGEPISESHMYNATAYWPDFKVASHGKGEPVSVPKTKVQTLFSQGKFLDADGNSVLPDGYSGSVTFFGGSTTVPALLEAQEWMKEPEVKDMTAAGFSDELKKRGVYINNSLFKKYRTDQGFSADLEGSIAGLDKKITELTDGLDTSKPESNAADLFDYNALGEPKFPANVAALYQSPYGSAEKSAYIKAAAANFGDGKIVGQHYSKMDSYEKNSWIIAFKNGDFAQMYQIEVTAAAKEGKPHAAGYLHPGYPGNSETNKVTWGAAVEGEIAAGNVPEGDWSSNMNDASMEEVNNYLIKAQMQNPTYLSPSERRAWVSNHKAGNKATVDQYSATAQSRKNSGEKELSDPLVWTDDVQPAKSYTKFFDDGPYPITQWQTYSGTQPAYDYVQDNPDNKELQDLYTTQKGVTYSEPHAAAAAVAEYFQSKKDEADALALIPVYTLKPNQTVKQSTHPVFQYTDQFGNEYFFKPRPDSKLNKYLSEVEHLGNQFGKFFGFKTTDSKLETLDGKYGNLQKDVGGVTDLMNVDYKSLTPSQIADIGNEHILDWFLDNDDTKGDNAKMLADGHIVGIDKGRAFKHFGAWNGLSGDSSMDSNAPTIYNKLYSTIRSGGISKEDADKAYLTIIKRAEKMAKANDDKIRDMLKEGMVNRDSFDNSYKIDGKKVPNTFEGLVAGVLDRKNKLPSEIEGMWKKIYKDAGYGDLPEKPDNPLGDVISGVDDARLHEEVFQAQATGKSTMLGGNHIIGGSALFWMEKTTGGDNIFSGEMYLAPKKQEEILAYLAANATDLSPVQAQVQGFSSYDKYGQPLIDAAKTINHHAVDGEYNQGKIDAFQAAQKNIESDLEEWAPGLQSNSNWAGEPSYLFKSGNNIPMQHVDQYKLMLDNYGPKAQKIAQAHENKGKVETVDTYAPLALKSSGSVYSNPDSGAKLSQLSGDSYIYNDGKGEVSVVGSDHLTVLDAQAGGGGWTEEKSSDTAASNSGIVITKNAYTYENHGAAKGHEKIVSPEQGGGVSGSGGTEYQITLPTGEKIFFRNAGNTNTAKGQQGKLTLRVDNVKDSGDTQSAMERLKDQLESLGITTDAADDTSAELAYWHEMYSILVDRVHEPGDAYSKTRKLMDAKVKEVGGDKSHFIEILGEKMDPSEETEFWRELWSAHFKTKVDDLLADPDKLLPKYDHQNLDHPELETGKPYWERFDVSLDDLLKKDFMLASSTGGEPLAMIKTGAALGAEERLRQLNEFNAPGSWSAHSDQQKGSSHNIYTRLVKSAGSHNAFYNPRQLLRIRTYSFGSDMYGDHAARKTAAPANPLTAIKNFTGDGGNETSLPHMSTLLDGIEVYAFEYAEKRNEAIQFLKEKGITEIRGLPVEDRLVMRNKLDAAIAKVKKTWAEK